MTVNVTDQAGQLMQITRYTDFAFRVLLYLSGLGDGELATITDISGAYGISRNHVVKVVHHLGRQGYIHTQRGRTGGIRLNRPASDINLGDVVRTVEATLNPVNCRALECPLDQGCSLYTVLNQSVNAYLSVLDSYTLADIVSDRKTAQTIHWLVS